MCLLMSHICTCICNDTCISCVPPGKVQDAVCCNLRGLILLMHDDSEADLYMPESAQSGCC